MSCNFKLLKPLLSRLARFWLCSLPGRPAKTCMKQSAKPRPTTSTVKKDSGRRKSRYQQMQRPASSCWTCTGHVLGVLNVVPDRKQKARTIPKRTCLLGCILPFWPFEPSLILAFWGCMLTFWSSGPCFPCWPSLLAFLAFFWLLLHFCRLGLDFDLRGLHFLRRLAFAFGLLDLFS